MPTQHLAMGQPHQNNLDGVRNIWTVFPEDLKGWIGQTETTGLLLDSDIRQEFSASQPAPDTLSPTLAVLSGHPSLWPLAERRCRSHLRRAIDCLSDLQSLDTGILFHIKCRCLLDPSLHPLPLCLLATTLLFPLLSHVHRLPPDQRRLCFHSFYLFPWP